MRQHLVGYLNILPEVDNDSVDIDHCLHEQRFKTTQRSALTWALFHIFCRWLENIDVICSFILSFVLFVVHVLQQETRLLRMIHAQCMKVAAVYRCTIDQHMKRFSEAVV